MAPKAQQCVFMYVYVLVDKEQTVVKITLTAPLPLITVQQQAIQTFLLTLQLLQVIMTSPPVC